MDCSPGSHFKSQLSDASRINSYPASFNISEKVFLLYFPAQRQTAAIGIMGPRFADRLVYR